jgi:hypothetical protein
MVSRAVQPDEAVLRGMKRSWLSLHFNTRHVRRWILVQFVTVPMRTEDYQETVASVQVKSAQPTIGRLLDDYMTAQFARRWA